MSEDIKVIMIERDYDKPYPCYFLKWEPFRADELLNLKNPFITGMAPRDRKKYIEKYRRTHNERAGLAANVCVREQMYYKENAERKMTDCAKTISPESGIKVSGWRVDEITTTNYDNCDMKRPEEDPKAIIDRAGKHKKLMLEALAQGDGLGAGLHLKDMEFELRKFESADKTKCFCGKVRLYTDDESVEKWEARNAQ